MSGESEKTLRDTFDEAKVRSNYIPSHLELNVSFISVLHLVSFSLMKLTLSPPNARARNERWSVGL
jgi:hypothetical protein